jgi:hypothetical protein
LSRLGVLDAIEVRTTAGSESFAVIQTRSVHDPSPLLELAHDPDLSIALDLALGMLPPGYWTIQALIASTLQIARGRQAVGPEVAAAVLPESTTP